MIVPILIVVAWLYATMFLLGFAINLVTATIAAVSIGIGIDFAIHFIVRFREEFERHGSRHTAVRITGGRLAIVNRQGRRVANVRSEIWQESRDRPIALSQGHYLLSPL